MTKRGEEVELLPCPFCDENDDGYIEFNTGQVHCVNCGAAGPVGTFRDEAVALWNTHPERKDTQ